MWWQAFCPWLHGYIECDSLCFVSRLSKPSSTDFLLHRRGAGGRTHTRSINILHDYRICMNDILLMCLCAPASYNLLTHLSKITELNVRYQIHQFWICIPKPHRSHAVQGIVYWMAAESESGSLWFCWHSKSEHAHTHTHTIRASIFQ